MQYFIQADVIYTHRTQTWQDRFRATLDITPTPASPEHLDKCIRQSLCYHLRHRTDRRRYSNVTDIQIVTVTPLT